MAYSFQLFVAIDARLVKAGEYDDDDGVRQALSNFAPAGGCLFLWL